jgi:hypothetical protein
MKRSIIFSVCLTLLSLASCKKFLTEEPRDVISPAQFYKTPAQIQVAVNGTYSQLQEYYQTIFLGLPVSDFLSVESLTGYSFRTLINGEDETEFTKLTQINNGNFYVNDIWKAIYYGIAQCNSVIINVSAATVVDDATKNRYLAEAQFLRAYYYFQLVQLYGDIPLKLIPVTGVSDAQAPRNKAESVYNQIVTDLLAAEKGGLPDVDASGHVTNLAVKSLLAKVYLTMAGYPLQKGASYYQLAYDKAKEVIALAPANNVKLFPNYSDWRQTANKNIGENIFMIQFEPVTINSMMHYSMLPYPCESSFSLRNDVGGGLAPDLNFYNSYQTGDVRAQDKQDFYHYTGPTPALMVYKYWDDEAAKTGKSGQNMPVIRYADVELIAAEAKANIDGGTTTDATALSAYYDVRHRAFPSEAKPGSITVDQVLQERFWEFAYENITWFDMVRTRKAMAVPATTMVPLIGYKAPQHSRAFTEGDMVLPIPLTEIQNNPKITDPPQ